MMTKIILYVLVILTANTIGAVSGMGGGIIIKPALQIFNWDSVLTINFYSSIAVFTMAVSSTWRQITAKNHVSKTEVVELSLGSVLGGVAGDISFSWFYSQVGDDISVVAQMLLVIVSLIVSLVFSTGHIKPRYLSGIPMMIGTGLGLGWLATVLGIGGGPINIACFLFLFGFGIRQATIYSIVTIFFSQAAKIVQAFFSGNIQMIDPFLVLAVMVAALFGGWLGATISNHITEKSILILYNLVIVFVLLLDIVNMVSYLVK
ncbi:sulfite exporter TauE/SafE family protein [Lacticaseibacillus rhamnosus]|uniref:sulfite exporter TauE/SafE family protein n=1 Tax=Lacticaseibacillus rhamnosus TaxID=47715 RepID=UPI0008B4B7E4|nr:sulfite exporter TauE/SafE family protein [Lacticaseibacillus rhamnosus]MDK7182417.1 sulfite exporter TauE/SafE family protein [Lacticaseibacillus rhamnosus]MDK7240392.1 sulfite exporter TauE/SafE family protein [Lacticaseibacillus rhamnosus]MDT8863562.1 sulfite exporter TauE/SafE family protein [Lacticaseibacillus rhamnosus]OFN10320.1 hypothetical protein HMPREF2621_02185 [Lactobacillus sp. HMSC072E07]